MAIRAIVLFVVSLVVVSFLFVGIDLRAQEDNSRFPIVLQKIVSDLVDPPNLGAFSSNPYTNQSSGNSQRNKKWLRVEFTYDVNPPQTNPNVEAQYLDEATFKVWIEARDYADPRAASQGQGLPVAFVGSVTYVNLYKGKGQFGAVFLHPATVERYGGPNNGIQNFMATDKYDVHVEASVGGQPICGLDRLKETSQTWYQQLKPLNGLVYNKDQTPFIVFEPERYPAIKLRGQISE